MAASSPVPISPAPPRRTGLPAAEPGHAGRLLLAVALALTAIVYLDTLGFEFVFDDLPQIVNNAGIRSWSSVPGFFTHHVWQMVVSGASGNFYRPLFLVWLVINYKIFGLHPAGWHLTTLLVHLAATWLVFVLARRVLRSEFGGAVAALVFGLHPTHLETVSWISGVTDSLLTVFFVGAFVAWLRARAAAERRLPWGLAALALFGLALLVKEPAVVLPGLVFAYEWLQGNPGERLGRALRNAAPFLAVTGAYLAVRAVILHGVAHAMTVMPWRTVVLTCPSLLWFYIVHLLWPFRIAEFYETPYVTAADGRSFYVPLLLTLAVCALLLLWWRRSRSPALAFSATWLVLPLLPALNIQTFQYAELAHDRYLYLSSAGFAMLVALAVERLRLGRTRFLGEPWPAVAAVLGMAIVLGIATATQNVQWTNTLLLYTRAFEVAPNNIHTVSPLSRELIRRGRMADALPLLERAAVLAPTDWEARFILADTCYLLGRYPEAERHLLEAIAIDPNSAAEYFFLGVSRLELRRPEQAEAPLRRAVAMLPQGKGMHQALARALAGQGKLDEARRELEAELRLDPQNQEAARQLQALAK